MPNRNRAYDARLATAARRLSTLGLNRVAESVTAFAATLAGDPQLVAERAWVDAYLRLEVAVDLC